MARPSPRTSTTDVVLVANRGEIARRITVTARSHGHRVVAVATPDERHALHAREADAVAAVPSYLDIDAVVAAAVEHGAAYVHPGYGFLSENAAFARALDAVGVTLVGPSAEVIELMGRKDRARDLALQAGVPVVPRGEPDGDEGFPVLVKAAAGGGGKGMRIVRSADDLDEAVAAAQREAAAAFGDDTMLVERYVEHGRHLEVQVLGDTHGTVVHLGDRECSAQRRHQKVLEEAPAPRISDEVRKTIRESAVALARHVGYVGAGTVEFLLDDATGEVFFLEMNTRLQVEHRVTERAVCLPQHEMLDLVAEQLRVAAGEPLGYGQDDLLHHGHAIEARVYAEDAYAGFLPQAGTAGVVRWHRRAPSLTLDHALESGQQVGSGYDPMLGKVIGTGSDREEALASLRAALDDTVILGLTTNTGFLRRLLDTDEVREARVETAWLDTLDLAPPDDSDARTVAAWTEVTALAHDHGGPAADPFGPDGWRLSGEPAPVLVDLAGAPRVRVDPGAVGGDVDGLPVRELHREDLPEGLLHLHLQVDGRDVAAYVHRGRRAVEVAHRGHRFVLDRPDPFRDSAAAVGDGTLLAPMPGTVVEVRVAPGETVQEGQVVAVMEAMKMELALSSPFAGVVAAVDVRAGDRVVPGAQVAAIDPSEPVEPGGPTAID